MKKDTMTLEEMLVSLSAGITHGIKKPNMLTYKPNPKQEVFHRMQHKGRQFVGGNRSGKTTGGIVEDLYWLTGKHPYQRTPEPPIFGRVTTVDFKQGVNQIILPQLSQWVPPSFLINGSWEDSYNSNEALLRLSNDSQLQIMTYEQKLESFAGVPRHFMHFDEEPPKAIFEECKLRLVDYNGKWWICETPVEGMTWTHEEVYLRGLSGDPLIGVVEVSIYDNSANLHEEAIEEILGGLDDDMRKIRGSGAYVAIGGAIFRYFNKEKNIIDVSEKEWIPPKDWTVYESMDHGLNNPTAWLWHAVSPKGTVVTFDEHYKRNMVVSSHAPVVLEKEKRLKEFGHEPYLRVGDPSIQQRNAETGLSIRILYSQHGLPIVLANNEVHGGLNKMNQYFLQNKWFITSNCVNLLKEIPKYRWKPYDSPKMRDKNNPREEPLKKDDHAIDSARYFFSFMPDLEPIEPEKAQDLTNEEIAAMLSPGTTFDPSKPYRVDKKLSRNSFPPNPVVSSDEFVGEW